jgi:SAM-dependent methyltransferase
VDSKQAEKEYLARTGSSEWERVKPFSPQGADTLVESVRLLQDFAAAMLALQPGSSDLVLDLGAGGCWCSDLLARLNRRSVAVDISWHMLQTGRSRPGGDRLTAVAGDMERLPFRSGAFDMAVCLNALHHVPDMRAGVREIARVLNARGVALFSEPGKGHADAAVSAAARRDFGVLEQEVLIDDLVEACHAAGFDHVRLKSMSYVLPEFDLTPDEWRAWVRAAASKRPTRALAKIGRGIMELFGVAKQGRLFEEAYGITLVRIVCGAVEAHPILVAAKGGPPARRQVHAADVVLEAGVDRAVAGGTARFRVRVHNRGTATWQVAGSGEPGHVGLGVQLLDAQQRLIARDHFRVALPASVATSGHAVIAFDCPMPAQPGAYHLKFDLVAEGVTWFEPAGSQPLLHRIVVG